MPFCLSQLKKEYENSFFFTSNKECIEYLLLENLQPLEEYAILVTGNEAWLFTPHFIECKEVKQILYEGYSNIRYQDKVQNILCKLDEFSLPLPADTAFERKVYGDYFEKRGCRVMDVTKQVCKAARIKTPKQLEAVEACVQINEFIYREISKKEACGESELTLFGFVREKIMEHTGFSNQMIYDFLAGKRTAQVSGFPTNYQIQKGDTLIADLLPRNNGVYADMTRTFFAGAPSDKQNYIYEICCEAMEKGEEALAPGRSAGEIYEAVALIFRKYGLECNFPHHAGHGLGMGYYEAPYFLKEETETLQENMVVALEPGLYIQGEFGIRIENNYVITLNGARRLGSLPIEISSYILTFGQSSAEMEKI